MTQVTPFTQRVRQSLREELLDAATALLPEHGFARLRMADVAAAAGVSRQTVYNEFGNKESLVTAVALRTEATFIAEGVRRIRAAAQPLDGIRDSLRWTITAARKNPLVASVLGAGAAVDLLPYLTAAAGEPLLHSATDSFAAVLTERLPELGERRARLLAEHAFRLLVSHIAQPTGSATAAAAAITELLAPHLTERHRDDHNRSS